MSEQPQFTNDQLMRAIEALLEKDSVLAAFGVPIPSLYDVKHPLEVAHGVPGKERFDRSWAEEQLKDSGVKLINQWTVMGHDVAICEDEKGRFALRLPHAGWKLTELIQSGVLRSGAVRWQAELKAMQRLAEYTTDPQYESYILNGLLIETSKRSKIKYVIRKARPTLALRADGEQLRCLAALCLHPLAYFRGTFCGSMAPTDEVIAHLLLIRGDECYYWRKSGQHRTWEPRSGI